MEQVHDTQFEKGYNMAYYLEQYAPDILKRAMKGLHGEPKEFFEGLVQGQKEGQRAMKDMEQQLEKEKDKEDLERQRIEREREAAYNDKLRKTQEHQKIEAHIQREFDENPFEQVLLKARKAQKQEREDSERRDRLKKQLRARNSEMRIDAAKLKERQDADKKYLDEIKQKFELKPKDKTSAVTENKSQAKVEQTKTTPEAKPVTKSETKAEKKSEAKTEHAATDKTVTQSKSIDRTPEKATESQTKLSDKVETRMQELADIRNTTQTREQEKSEGRDTTKNR